MRTQAIKVAGAFVWWLVGCHGAGDDGDRLRVGNEPIGGSRAGAGAVGAAAQGAAGNDKGSGGRASVSTGDSALTVRVEKPGGLTIELVTIQCAGDCADVTAVAHGGNPPYAFTWDDDSTSPTRHVCPNETTTYRVSATDTAIEDEEFAYDAQVASSHVTAEVLVCTDAGSADVGCDLDDELVSDVTGATRFFAGGASLPAGRYRVEYVGGCMRFGAPVGWSVHNLVASWWLVDETGAQLEALPGVAGGLVGFETFDACVAASLAESAPLDIDFAGGKLGAWLLDMPYDDNVAGEDGENPTWRITRLAPCE